MDETFSRNVRPVLDLVDKLREIGISQEISLPQIAVMGDQSSGKSSVLQSISGLPFPRGSGLVTRCPVELMMKKTPVGSPWRAEVSVRWDRPQPAESGTTTNMDDLLSRIQALSNILAEAGENGFSRNSIAIKVSSPESPDLTLIDLPGIVRTATAGQHIGVIDQVNGLIDYYIQQPNTIILAVIPSNQDIATIDILERASKVDTSGVRTLGVLTKPDLIGPGNEEEVLQTLLNKRKPLHLGYIMVKNSSQKQLNEKMTITGAKEDELDFFQNHPYFGSHLNTNLFGVDNLVKVLTKLLITHIKRTLPSMMKDIRNLLMTFHAELTTFGDSELINNDTDEMKSALTKKVSYFNHVLRSSSKGEYRDKKGVLALTQDVRLYGQISQFFKVLQDKVLSLRPAMHLHHPPILQSQTSTTAVPTSSLTASAPSSTKNSTRLEKGALSGSNNNLKEYNRTHSNSISGWNSYVEPVAETATNTEDQLTLEQTQKLMSLLEEEMSSQRGRELPGFLSTQVFTSCMVQLIEEWRLSMDECASNTISSSINTIQNISNVLFRDYPYLNEQINLLNRSLMENISIQLKDSLENLIMVEQEPFTTQEVLLEVVNSIRFRTFDTVLRQIIDGIDVKEMSENRYLIEEDMRKKLGKKKRKVLFYCRFNH
jgi:GTPase SAR1 family protein